MSFESFTAAKMSIPSSSIKGRKVAVAYQLGKVTLYDEPMELKDLGLDYVPQSFAYI